ncbi:MAG: hypothetical protein EOM23_07355, partial [Candidatus Moranbacteria bacterium]|nr:hypothetical protein [Candidatus Moranbacteria bacterium]
MNTESDWINSNALCGFGLSGLGFMIADKMKNFFKTIWLFLFAAFIIFTLRSCMPGVDKDLEIEQKVEALLAKMTLEEKIGQMTMVRHFDGDIEKDIG